MWDAYLPHEDKNHPNRLPPYVFSNVLITEFLERSFTSDHERLASILEHSRRPFHEGHSGVTALTEPCNICRDGVHQGSYVRLTKIKLDSIRSFIDSTYQGLKFNGQK